METISLTQFRDCGYQIVPDIVDAPIVNSIRRFLEQAAEEALAEIGRAVPFAGTNDLIARIDELHRTGAIDTIDPEIAKLISGHLPLASRLDPSLWAVARSPRLRAVLTQLFPGQKQRMHLPPAARYVLPRNPHAMVPAHQDVTYNKHMPEFVTIWVPFVPIDARCGGVAVHAGTHRTPELILSDRKGFWHEAIRQTDSEVIGCEVPLGGALLLSDSIIHQSMANDSDRIRLSIDYRFFGDGASSKHYLDLDTMAVIAPGASAERVAAR